MVVCVCVLGLGGDVVFVVVVFVSLRVPFFGWRGVDVEVK